MFSKIKKTLNYIAGGLFIIGAVYFFGFYEPKPIKESIYNLWSTFDCGTVRSFLLNRVDLREDVGYDYIDFVNMSEVSKFPNSSAEIGLTTGDRFTCSADMMGGDGSVFENTLIYIEVGESDPEAFLKFQRLFGVNGTEATYVPSAD